jgi:hypothetical protein
MHLAMCLGKAALFLDWDHKVTDVSDDIRYFRRDPQNLTVQDICYDISSGRLFVNVQASGVIRLREDGFILFMLLIGMALSASSTFNIS